MACPNNPSVGLAWLLLWGREGSTQESGRKNAGNLWTPTKGLLSQLKGQEAGGVFHLTDVVADTLVLRRWSLRALGRAGQHARRWVGCNS